MRVSVKWSIEGQNQGRKTHPRLLRRIWIRDRALNSACSRRYGILVFYISFKYYFSHLRQVINLRKIWLNWLPLNGWLSWPTQPIIRPEKGYVFLLTLTLKMQHNRCGQAGFPLIDLFLACSIAGGDRKPSLWRVKWNLKLCSLILSLFIF